MLSPAGRHNHAAATQSRSPPPSQPYPAPPAHSRSRTMWRGRGRRPSSFLVFFVRRFDRRRNHVLLRRPIAEVDDAAPIAAKGHVRIVELHFFLTNRTFHRTAYAGWI